MPIANRPFSLAGLVALLTLTLVLTLGSAELYAEQCQNSAFKRVLAKGKLVVGVKDDYRPWGYRTDDNSIVGFEVDLAREVADAMGVALETHPVLPTDRIQLLEDGEIDLLIATMSDRADRRQKVGIALPNYYTSGTNILSPKSLSLKSWSDLAGQPVCGNQGAFYNKLVVENYGAEMITFPNTQESKQALKDGKCVAWVYDDSSIMSDLASGDWDSYEMPLSSADQNPWGLAVPLAEKDCAFGHMMSGLQYNWLRSGKLIELEKKWGIQPTEFLAQQRERFADWLVN